uniref:Transposon TX1 uncharacterized n=1 Tax=Cajanus cajan TaxID=3821 RepID=A0A151TBW9_CAJCA|nr:Transposon TX1 uncharacterized [Cajanus cajan]
MEIKEVVWACGGNNKSPRSDGYNFKFIKSFWHILKIDIVLILDEFYVNGRIPRGENFSFITFIPKKNENPKKFGEYRPISLVRLKVVLEKVIGELQCAFIGGRNILDGVLIANEMVDEAKRNKNPCLIFKFDYEKTYDLVF